MNTSHKNWIHSSEIKKILESQIIISSRVDDKSISFRRFQFVGKLQSTFSTCFGWLFPINITLFSSIIEICKKNVTVFLVEINRFGYWHFSDGLLNFINLFIINQCKCSLINWISVLIVGSCNTYECYVFIFYA